MLRSSEAVLENGLDDLAVDRQFKHEPERLKDKENFNIYIPPSQLFIVIFLATTNTKLIISYLIISAKKTAEEVKKGGNIRDSTLWRTLIHYHTTLSSLHITK